MQLPVRKPKHEAESMQSWSEDEKENMRERIERVNADLNDLEAFYNIEISPQRSTRLKDYYEGELAGLEAAPFDELDQQEKVDHLLLKNYLKRKLRQLDLEAAKDKKTEPLLPFAVTIIRLCEDRQHMIPINGQKAAEDIHEITQRAVGTKGELNAQKINIDKTSAFRAARTVDRLRDHLAEWFEFFNGYDPMFSWWVAEPYTKVKTALVDLANAIRLELVGVNPGDKDAIIGDPIGRNGLLVELEAERIPYTPEELIDIGEKQYEWCLREMKKAAHDLDPGYGDNWKAALEHVKNNYVPPGKQTELIRYLSEEAVGFVTQRDMVTIPPLANECWRMFMMSPAQQKVSPFFLGGDDILVAYPTSAMGHEDKLMSMRGNNPHFSRSTVFHELVPGHHLQFHYISRSKPYRYPIFTTPFSIEGWSLYWELILWDLGFAATPENRIGMLFWRMHRCARIIFSLKFHLGEMTPQECIDMLVDRVGHERSTAEGEVRRSFAGDYSPLYQAGYLLGGLQLYALRHELVTSGKMSEKQFHDRFLKENTMPIEIFRALVKKQPLKRDFESSWRFYQDLLF